MNQSIKELAEAFDFTHELGPDHGEADPDYPPHAECFVLFKDTPTELEAVKAELEMVRQDNANLIEMNFNLEQQVSALKEDLEEALEECAEWSEANFDLDYKVQELLSALQQIEDMAANR